MKKIKTLSILFIACLLASLIFPMYVNKVHAETENVVTLNFEGGIIHDGYVEYSGVGKLQLFKGDELVINISNDMKIDLNESEYKFVIEEIENTESVSSVTIPIKLNINNWYYPMTTIAGESKSTFKLESSKFSGTLNVKVERKLSVVNTKVEKVYSDITSTGTIDLSDKNEYIIDFSKNDELTNGLKTFADLKKTLYYKRENNSLIKTENEAVIKIVGNEDENKAILTAVNVKDKKKDQFKGLYTKYTGSKLEYNGTIENIINETRTEYYTRCTYDFTFKYVEEVEPKEYKVIEGANQKYTIDESKNATFRIDAEYNVFENGGKVYVDNTLVDNNNYTSKSGSTIITLKDAYLKTLSVGEHTLKVAFTDGGEATTKFEIAKKIEENKDNDNNDNNDNNNNNNNNDNSNKNDNIDNTTSNTENENKEETISNPKTGDNVMIYVTIASMSILGLGATIVSKKRKIN